MKNRVKPYLISSLFVIVVISALALLSACSADSNTTTIPPTSSSTPPASETPSTLPSLTVSPSPLGPSPGIVSSILPSGSVGKPYNYTLEATSGTPPFVWKISNEILPLGLSLDPGTGVISGIPTGAAVYVFSLKVSDSLGVSASRAFSINISSDPAVTPSVIPTPATITPTSTTTPTDSSPTPISTAMEIVTSSLPDAMTNTYYSYKFLLKNDVSPVTWTYYGQLPEGLKLDARSGMLFGNPPTPGTFTLIIQATDITGQVAVESITLKISRP